MRILSFIIAFFEAVPFAQFHSRPLQLNILSSLDNSEHQASHLGGCRIGLVSCKAPISRCLGRCWQYMPAWKAVEESQTPCWCRELEHWGNPVSWSTFWISKEFSSPYNPGPCYWSPRFSQTMAQQWYKWTVKEEPKILLQRGRKDSVLGWTSRFSLVSCLHPKSRQLGGRLPQPAVHGPSEGL